MNQPRVFVGPLPPEPPSHPSGCHGARGWSSLHRTADSHWRPVYCIEVNVLQHQTQTQRPALQTQRGKETGGRLEGIRLLSGRPGESRGHRSWSGNACLAAGNLFRSRPAFGGDVISKRGFHSPWGPRHSPSKGEDLKEVLEGRGEPPPREWGLWKGSMNFSFSC